MTNYYRNIFIFALIVTIIFYIISVVAFFIVDIPVICCVTAAFVAFICSNVADNNYREYLYWKRIDKECVQHPNPVDPEGRVK